MLECGETVGRYEVLERLHVGQNFTYYRASQGAESEITLAQSHDLYRLYDMVDELERTLDERVLLAHPDVPRLQGWFWDEDDRLILELELLEGASLGELARGGMPPRLAVHVILRMLRILRETLADAREACRANLRPNSIMITGSGLYLTMAPRVPAYIQTTGIGTLNFDYSFMSPEMVKGLPVDERALTFVMCSLLFALISGRTPFRKENSIATLRAIVEEPADRLSKHVQVDPQLDQILFEGHHAGEDRMLPDELESRLRKWQPNPLTDADLLHWAQQQCPGLQLPDDASDTGPMQPAGPDDLRQRCLHDIIRDPTRVEPYLVYADVLQAEDDPQGELIVLCDRERQAPLAERAKHRRDVQRFLRQHPSILGDLAHDVDRYAGTARAPSFDPGPHFLGDLSHGPVVLQWFQGFIQRLRIHRLAATEYRVVARALEEMPIGRFLQGLAVAAESCDHLSLLLPFFGVRSPRIRDLFFGDVEPVARSYITVNKQTVGGRLRNVERLALRGYQVELAALSFPVLEELRISARAQPAPDPNGVRSCRLPRLRTVVLEVPQPYIVRSVRALFRTPIRLPSLERIEVANLRPPDQRQLRKELDALGMERIIVSPRPPRTVAPARSDEADDAA